MKIIECPKCKRVQTNGRFCLDDGTQLIEKVTLGVKFKPINTSRGTDTLKYTVRNLLMRIGVQNKDIVIEEDGSTAQVVYWLTGKKYRFKSYLQNNFKNNLAAVEQFLAGRVIGIERGIETAEQAFAGYVALPPPKDVDTMPESELRELLKKHHPDTGDGDVVQFQKVKEALDRRDL